MLIACNSLTKIFFCDSWATRLRSQSIRYGSWFHQQNYVDIPKLTQRSLYRNPQRLWLEKPVCNMKDVHLFSTHFIISFFMKYSGVWTLVLSCIPPIFSHLHPCHFIEFITPISDPSERNLFENHPFSRARNDIPRISDARATMNFVNWNFSSRQPSLGVYSRLNELSLWISASLPFWYQFFYFKIWVN